MTRPSGSDLADRLRTHVPQRFADGGRSWWGPPSGRVAARAAAVEHLALLVVAGRPLRDALADGAAGDPDGPAVAAARLAAGATAPDAVRAWARACGCATLGTLAVELERAVSTDEVVVAVRSADADLRRRAEAELLADAVRRAWLVTAAAVAATSASVVLVLW